MQLSEWRELRKLPPAKTNGEKQITILAVPLSLSTVEWSDWIGCPDDDEEGGENDSGGQGDAGKRGTDGADEKQ